MKIAKVDVYPVSHKMGPGEGPTLGVGRMVKRDAIIIKITSDDGVVGWGEAHHARAPAAVARLIEGTLANMVVGMSAYDVVGVWQRLYRGHLATHGMGAGTVIAMSGIDMALWDLRGKAAGLPLCQLLGGDFKDLPAYAGGLSLGFQPEMQLVEEASGLVEQGYRALKLRLGDTPANDLARVQAVREALGSEVEILTDVNAAYDLAQVAALIPGLDEYGVGWLEEPFPPFDEYNYKRAAAIGRTPLAAGENHYTRFDFARLLEQEIVTVLQPDLSKAGGITEVLRIAAMASVRRLSINPHTSMSGLNMAASLHLLSAIENPGLFEADVSCSNLFRTALTSEPYSLDANGKVQAPKGPGLGVEVDESFLAAHPLIDGPCYV